MEAAPLLVIVLMIVATLLIRIAPKLRGRFVEVDAYYFLLTAEEFKKRKKLPVKLPSYYLLDVDEQWYPPIFTVLLGSIPSRILKRFYWLIPSLLDASNLTLLLILTYTFTDSLVYLALVGLVYVFTPALTSEYLTLTSKALSNLILSLEVLSLIFLLQNPSLWMLGLAISFCYLLFITHKMTMQFLVFLYIFLAIVLNTLLPLVIISSTVLLLLATLRGYYIDILRAHYDIVIFWHRNWKHLWAHQVYDSPVYGKAPSKPKGLRERLLKGGGRPLYFFLQGIVGKNGNPYLILPVLAYGIQPQTMNDAVWSMLLYWSIAILLLMALVTFVPHLRLFGEGHKYAKMAALPTSVLATELLIYGDLPLQALTVLILLFSILRLFSIYRSNLRAIESAGEADLIRMLEYIKADPEIDYILCLKGNLSDAVAYYCRRRVLWGTHHYYFNTKLVDFYPVLRKPLKWFKQTYDVKYVLADRRYVNPSDIGVKDDYEIWSAGQYTLYRL